MCSYNDSDGTFRFSVSEAHAMEKAKKVAMAAKPKLSDSGAKLEKMKNCGKTKPAAKYLAAPLPSVRHFLSLFGLVSTSWLNLFQEHCVSPLIDIGLICC